GEARPLAVCPLGPCLRAEDAQLAVDPLRVEAREQTADEARRRSRAVARDPEADLLAAPAGVGRAEEEGGAVAVLVVVDHELEPSSRPPLRKARLDLPPLLEERHGGQHTASKLSPVAKVEERGALPEEDLRGFFREMLLIRRF